MSINFESRYAIGPKEYKTLDTQGLRDNFLIEKVFETDKINFESFYSIFLLSTSLSS